MRCRDCKYWQGHSGSEWGDCYRIIGSLEPDILLCHAVNADGYITEYLNVPFDPHDIKYWEHKDPQFVILLDKVINMEYPKGVRLVLKPEQDIVFDRNGGQRIDEVLYPYFQTHRDYECEDYE